MRASRPQQESWGLAFCVYDVVIGIGYNRNMQGESERCRH
jgi:hypothetical protein